MIQMNQISYLSKGDFLHNKTWTLLIKHQFLILRKLSRLTQTGIMCLAMHSARFSFNVLFRYLSWKVDEAIAYMFTLLEIWASLLVGLVQFIL